MENAAEARQLLSELYDFLNAHHEKNWIRGIRAALIELSGPDDALNAAGFESARSIYNSMIQGGRGFSEYFVWNPDAVQRSAANKTLDDLRERLWNLFKPLA